MSLSVLRFRSPFPPPERFSISNNFGSKKYNRYSVVFASTSEFGKGISPPLKDYTRLIKESILFICGRACYVSGRQIGEIGLNLFKVQKLLKSIKWDDKGLVVAIAQNVDSGAILMQGFANEEAVSLTASLGKATFYSRSRSKLWTKGETSNNFIHIHDIYLDCDCDSIIYLGKPDGPTCHTGAETCYYTSLQDDAKQKLALTTLYSLESTIRERKAELAEPQSGKPSWTKRLLLDNKLICSKIREEADELCRTLEENEDKLHTASEMADVLYHSMVLLAVKDVQMEDVLQILRQRFSQSGIEEKQNRGPKS